MSILGGLGVGYEPLVADYHGVLGEFGYSFLGPSTGSWGVKNNYRYHFDPGLEGWFLGLYTGYRQVQTEVELPDDNKENVKHDVEPDLTQIGANSGYRWQWGNGFAMVLRGGYGFPLQADFTGLFFVIQNGLTKPLILLGPQQPPERIFLMLPFNSKIFGAIVASTVFFSCNRQNDPVSDHSPETAIANPSGYTKAWIQLKSENLAPESHRIEAEKIATTFGYSISSESRDASIEIPEAFEGAMPKAGATFPSDPVQSQYRDFIVMFGRVNSYFSHYVQVTVKNGEVLKGSTVANLNNSDPEAPDVARPPADPFMVAFYQTATTNDPNAYPVKMVAFNDDIDAGNTDCAISWTNNTGSTKTVTVLSFVYSTEGRGFTTARVSVMSGNYGKLKYQKERWISATPNWQAKYPNESGLYTAGPLGSKIQMIKGTSAAFEWGYGLLALNTNTKKGGFVFNTEGVLDLPEVWKAGYPNLFIGICECKGYGPNDPTNYNYVSTELRDTYGLAVP